MHEEEITRQAGKYSMQIKRAVRFRYLHGEVGVLRGSSDSKKITCVFGTLSRGADNGTLNSPWPMVRQEYSDGTC